MSRRNWVLASCLAAALTAGLYVATRHPPAESRVSSYAPAASCARCHARHWETYSQTGMGGSFTSVVAARSPIPEQGSYHHAASGRNYAVFRRDGKLYQRRHEAGFDGRETNAAEREIHYVLGSGNHSRSFLHRRSDGRLVELPLGWYAENNGSWAMNPGFDRPDHDDFRREINFQCMFCHNGYPDVLPGADAAGTAPIYPETLPQGIDCQRCHGPGRAHVEAMQAGRPAKDTILNPSRLSADRQLELCMQCHLETTSFRLPGAIVRYDRPMFSYRPGEPLGNYVLHFDHAPGAGPEDKFEIAHAGYRMRQSACFKKSGGALTCTTCHNPHEAPRGEAAARRYTSACLGCHEQALRTLTASSKHTPAGDCLGCHMPKRRTEDVVHVVMTDHFIQRRKPARDLTAPLAERRETNENSYRGEVALYYPAASAVAVKDRELYLAVAQVRQGANLERGVPALAAAVAKYQPPEAGFYFELAQAFHKMNLESQAISMYEAALARQPRFVPAIRGLAATLARSGQRARAADILRKAIDAGLADAGMWNDLGLTHLALGNATEAAASLRQAIASNPDFAEAHNNLGGVLLSLGDRAGAEAAFRGAINAQPDMAEARRNLANLLAESSFSEGEHHYLKAIAANSAYSQAYYDYGLALARREEFAKARRQFEAAALADPKMAEAHNALGEMFAIEENQARALESFRRAVAARPELAAAQANLGAVLLTLGRVGEAKPHLENAVRLNPEAFEVRLQLGRVLASERNFPAAAEHLRKAAASPDREIQNAAREALGRLP